MDGPNTKQISVGNMNCHNKFKPDAHFLIAIILVSLRDFDHTSPNQGHSPQFIDSLFNMIYTRSHISKLGAFTLVCRFSQYDLHKIIHLQTKGILPSLSILSSTRSTRDHISPNQGHSPSFVDSLNMIYTRSYISKLREFSLVCRFSSQHHLYKIIHLHTRDILPNLSIKQSSLNTIYTRSHISKLRTFTFVCRFFQYDLHKIIHLQTKGILPSLSILFSTSSLQDHTSSN